MNCTVHPEAAATAYCRTCGKALCEQCARSVRGVVYCEDCIATRLHDTMPAAPATPPHTVVVTTGPSAGLAAVLSIFFPFGVGQVYNGQYAKGLAHMLIFIALIGGISAADSAGAAAWYGPVFGIALAFFYVYQIIDAARSAKAIQLGQPAPDPFGLGRTFGAGERVNIARVPIGAVILIALGVLFLFNTMGFFHFYWISRLWPLVLIGLGVWLLIKRLSPPSQGGVADER